MKQLARWLYGAYAWLLFVLVMLSFGALIVLLQRPAQARPLARSTARTLFFLAGIRVSAHGLERLPDGPHILLVNHTSFLDAIVLTALLPARPGYTFTTRQQFRSQIVLWPLLRALGTIVFKPTVPLHSSPNLGLMAAALRRGGNIVVFPEGGFVPGAGLQPFHSGAFVVAEMERLPVVVAGLRGARKALRPGTWMPCRNPIRLEIGMVISPEAFSGRSPLQLAEIAHAAMEELTGEKPALA